MECIFTNYNNVKIKLIDNPKSIIFKERYNHIYSKTISLLL
jgi:hypothetical protein